MRILVIVFFLNFFITFLAVGQKSVVRQDLFWLKYSASYNLNEAWSLNYFIEDRNFFKNVRSNHFLNSISATRKLKKNWSVGFGYVYFILSLPQDPSLDEISTRPEHRPFQSLSFKKSLTDKLSYQLRYQVEERFRRNFDAEGRAPGYNAEIRIRHKTSLKYALTPKLDAIIYDELMVHFGENITTNVFDQNRISLGFDWQVVDKLKLGISYINWYQQRGAGESFYQRNIFTLALNHQLN